MRYLIFLLLIACDSSRSTQIELPVLNAVRPDTAQAWVVYIKEKPMSNPKVCDCGRIFISGVWIRCPDVVRQLQDQEVEVDIELCDQCEIPEVEDATQARSDLPVLQVP